jgi:hypothetical protein
LAAYFAEAWLGVSSSPIRQLLGELADWRRHDLPAPLLDGFRQDLDLVVSAQLLCAFYSWKESGRFPDVQSVVREIRVSVESLTKKWRSLEP